MKEFKIITRWIDPEAEIIDEWLVNQLEDMDKEGWEFKSSFALEESGFVKLIFSRDKRTFDEINEDICKYQQEIKEKMAPYREELRRSYSKSSCDKIRGIKMDLDLTDEEKVELSQDTSLCDYLLREKDNEVNRLNSKLTDPSMLSDMVKTDKEAAEICFQALKNHPTKNLFK